MGNKWKLNTVNLNGQVTQVTNSFYIINRAVTQNVNGVETLTRVNDTYYFDADGSMMINATTPDGYIVGIDGKLAI